MSILFIRIGFISTLLLAVLNLSAQAGKHYEGDALVYFIGKQADSEELNELKADYKCEMANQLHFLSTAGLELFLRDNVLNEIRLYKNSAVYGSFTGSLPKKLKFGITPGDVKQLLGKPIISYNSGYCEYSYTDCVLSCWFDGGHLTQVSLSKKQTF